jgi:hypothetical protein
MPGPAEASDTFQVLLVTPPQVTVTAARVVVSSSHGIWKLICVGETKNKGTGMAPIRTVTPPRLLSKGRELAAWTPGAR